MALSDQEQQAYLDKGGNNCPKCQSDNISADSLIETDGTEAWRKIECSECGFEFTDIYKLTGVEETT